VAFWLYILECADKSLYVGQTDDLDKRMAQHEAGTTGSYTARRKPFALLLAQPFETRVEAMTAERMLKGWSRAEKLAYVAGDWARVSALAKGEHSHQRSASRASTSRPVAATLSEMGVEAPVGSKTTADPQFQPPERRRSAPKSKGAIPPEIKR